jgi:hypothetical protein
MPLFGKLQNLLRNLLHVRHVDADLSEELRSHVQLLTDQNLRASMSPAEAQRATRTSVAQIVLRRGTVFQPMQALREE